MTYAPKSARIRRKVAYIAKPRRPYSSLLPSRKYGLNNDVSSEDEVSSNDDSSYYIPFNISNQNYYIEDSSNNSLSNDSETNCSSTKDVTVSDSIELFTAWEKWLLKKNEELHKKKLEAKHKEVKNEQIKKIKETERKKRENLAFLKSQEWLAQKREQELKKKLKEEQIIRKKAECEEKRLQAKKEKNEKELQNWKEKKIQEQKEKVRMEAEKEEEAAERRKKREAENSAKFNEWLKKCSSRPLRVAASIGYNNGSLVGYYDWSSYPAPSFYNPTPWSTSVDAESPKKCTSPKQSFPSEEAVLSPPLLWKEVKNRSRVSNKK